MEAPRERAVASKRGKENAFNNPFRCLKEMVATVPQVRPAPVANAGNCEGQVELAAEQELFRRAMADVTPLACERGASPSRGRNNFAPPRRSEQQEGVQQLVALVEHGVGFVIADTPEYMEGTGEDVPREFARRLHQGDFSVQAYVDLHGYSTVAAKEVFDLFLHRAVMAGMRNVLIVHGRGLSSPGEPVLKNKVCQWLTSRTWRKWIIAFASARVCDGGAGATYVLLRSRPASRRRRLGKEL